MSEITIRDIAISFGYDVDKSSEKKANDSVNKLKATATKALGAIGIVFSIRGLASLAEAAANAEALGSQFTSVFGDMESTAAESLGNIADTTGVVANRIRGSFTQIAAFAKTTGMDTANALSLSDRALRAVADSAAFYDKSIEDVTHSLQSYLKGNFAVDAALGISSTETTRNAAANALYGKSFKDLAEDQKQLTLLSMVEEGNKLSGAMGQAAREADTWGNQLGNMKQSLTDLKAAAGAAFLKPAIQVLKIASVLVGHLTEGVKSLTVEGTFLNRLFERMTNRTRTLQDVVGRFMGRLGGAEKLLKLVAIAAGSFLSVFAVQKIISVVSALKDMDKALMVGKLKIVGIIAVIAIIALLIEDLVNFMQGNDSLMGELFEKFGIDGDMVRETIQGMMDSVSGLLPLLLELGKELGGTLLEAAKELLPLLLEMAVKLLPLILPLLAAILPLLVQLTAQVLPILLDMTVALLPLLLFLVEIIGSALVGALEGTEPVIGAFIGALEALLNFIKAVFAGDWEAAWEHLVSIPMKLLEGLKESFRVSINFIIDIINGLLSGLGNITLPDWVPGVGGKSFSIPLIPRLEKGSRNTPDTFIAGDVNGKGGELIAGAKGRRVFTAAETGNIFQTLREIAMLGATPRMDTVASATGSVKNKSIVQNVEITNKFEGDRAGQKKSSEAMDKAADDSTSAMARALAYVQ